MNHQHVVAALNGRDGRKILDAVIRQIAHEERVHHVRRPAEQDQCVAIGRRLGEHVRSDRAVGAGTVVDDDLLTEALGEFGRQHARDRIDTAAGRKGDDEPQRFRGISLLGQGRMTEPQRDAAEHESDRARRGHRGITSARWKVGRLAFSLLRQIVTTLRCVPGGARGAEGPATNR